MALMFIRERGGKVTNRSRMVIAWSWGALMLVVGCQGPLHTDAKAGRNPEWDRVRARVLNQLAEKQIQGHEYLDATQSLSESMALDPAQPDTYAKLARTQLELGKSTSANRVLQSADREGVHSAELTYLRGVILEQAEDYQSALSKFELARSIDLTQVDYFVAQIECLVILGRHGEALALVEKHILSFDEDATVATLAGYLALATGDEEKAVRRLRQAHLATRDNQVVADELAFLLVKQRRFVEALGLLDSMIESGGKRGMTRALAARCHMAMGKPAEASQAISPYAAQNPDDVETQLLLGYAALASKDIGTAWLALERAEHRDPLAPNVRLFYAAVARDQGDFASAEATLNDLLQQSPELVDAHCLLAELQRDQEDYESAQQHFERALTIDETCGWAAEGLRMLAKTNSFRIRANRQSSRG